MPLTNILPELIAFIEARTGAKNTELTRESPVEQTHGMAELDTILFYNDFVKHFNIRIPSDWDISNHVSPVGCYNWKHYCRWFFSKTYRKQTAYRDLTVGELEDMIKTGVWKDLRHTA